MVPKTSNHFSLTLAEIGFTLINACRPLPAFRGPQ